MGNFALTKLDMQKHLIMWSDYYQRLIFPYFSDHGLIGWQGRYLGSEDKPKWYSQGDLKNILHVVGNKLSDTVVLVEDIISAIKVAHNTHVCACPLFGSHISTQKMLQLKKKYCNMYIWLDKDIQLSSAKFAHAARLLGLNAHNIITDKDPKSYSDQQISEFLNVSTDH